MNSTKSEPVPTDLTRLARMADSWRAIGRTSEANEIDRAVAELRETRDAEDRRDA